MIDKNQLYLLARAGNRQLFNPTVIKHRQFDCHIATAKQCGTHWIKYMLSLVLCNLHSLPYPENIKADTVVGHTKTPPQYNQIPQIAVTHSHPHYFLRIPNFIDNFGVPKLIVLVRDPRDILVSSYEKTKGEYLDKKMERANVTFSNYLQGDVTGKTRIEDIWGLTLFFNSWYPVLQSNPDHTLMVHYEDMIENTEQILSRVCQFIGLDGVTDDILKKVVEDSSRRKMKKNIDPNEAQAEKSVNIARRNFREWYNDNDRQFTDDVFSRYLKYDFGYDLKDW